MSTRKNAILSWKETLVTLKAQREGQLDNRSRWAVSQCVKSYELHVHKEESHLFVRSRIEAAPLLDWLNWYECTKTLHWGAWKQTAENAFGAFPDITLIVITQPAPAVKTRESSILQNWSYNFWKHQILTQRKGHISGECFQNTSHRICPKINKRTNNRLKFISIKTMTMKNKCYLWEPHSFILP